MYCPHPSQSRLISEIHSGASAFPTYDMFVFDSHDYVSKTISRTKMWDKYKTNILVSEFAAIRKQERRNSILLDIGANIGWFTILAASNNVTVNAVEASSLNSDMIQSSLCVNKFRRQNLFDNVKLHKVAVGANTMNCTLVARRNNIASPASICGHNDPQTVMNDWGRNKGFNDYRIVGEINMVRIDDIIDSEVDIIKIDVEGNELEVAKGWENIFKAHPPRLVLTEYVPSLIAKISNTSNPLDYLKFFIQRGYEIHSEHSKTVVTNEDELYKWKSRWINDLIIRKRA